MSEDNGEVKDYPCESYPTFKRNNYFYGKLLSVADFQTEQQYYINKHRLINRLVHGSGVICGLKVLKSDQVDPNKPLDKDAIRIMPGIALDPYGREIVVPAPVDISLAEKLKGAESPAEILIKYDFCTEEKAPKVMEASSCKEECCDSIMKESYQIIVNAPKKKETETPKPSEDICAQWNLYLQSQKDAFCARACLEPNGEEAVFLAQVEFSIANGVVNVEKVSNSRTNVYGNDVLYTLLLCLKKEEDDLSAAIDELKKKPTFPKITTLNWTHNYACRSIKEWVKMCEGDLKITFSMPMKKETINTDVLRLILEVTVEAQESEMKRIAILSRVLMTEETEKTTSTAISIQRIDLPVKIKSVSAQEVVFSISPTNLSSLRLLLSDEHLRNMIANKLRLRLRLIVQLEGDFVFDEKGRRCLDADFLRGKLPTGNGCEGGLFESWFSVEIPEVLEQLELSNKMKATLTAAGKTMEIMVAKANAEGIRMADYPKYTPADLAVKLDIPEEAAAEAISTVKATEDIRELNEVDYDSLQKMKAEGINSRADVAKLSTAELSAKLNLSEEKANAVIAKAKLATQPG